MTLFTPELFDEFFSDGEANCFMCADPVPMGEGIFWHGTLPLVFHGDCAIRFATRLSYDAIMLSHKDEGMGPYGWQEAYGCRGARKG